MYFKFIVIVLFLISTGSTKVITQIFLVTPVYSKGDYMYMSTNLIWHTCYQLQRYSEYPFSCVNVLLVCVKADYVSGNDIVNDSHSDSKYWVTIWSYVFL